MLFVAETPGGAKPLQGCLEISPVVQLTESALEPLRSVNWPPEATVSHEAWVTCETLLKPLMDEG